MIKCIVNTSNRTINLGNYIIKPKDVIYLSEENMSMNVQQQLNNLSNLRILNVTTCTDESNIQELDGEPIYRSIRRAKPEEEIIEEDLSIEEEQPIVNTEEQVTEQLDEVIEEQPKQTKRKTKHKTSEEE